MLDLETMGNGPLAAIVAIGAVSFVPDEPASDREYYAHVELGSALRVGMQVDADTVMWWLRQKTAARAAIAKPSDVVPLDLALRDLADFYAGSQALWAAPAAFDIPIVVSAFRACALTVPWRIGDTYCWSTVRRLLGVSKVENPNEHHALADAKAQVAAFRTGWRRLMDRGMLSEQFTKL